MQKTYKIDKVWLVVGAIFLVSISMLFWNILSINPSYSSSLITQEKVNISFNDNEVHKALLYNLIEGLAINVSEGHVYKLHKFDCTEFSKELLVRLKENGIKARCDFGKLKGADYSLHTWVVVLVGYIEIPIESTGGYIISLEDYNENYKLIKKNACL